MAYHDADDSQDRAPELVALDPWERRWRFVYARIRGRVPTHEDVQDLAQEAMIRTIHGLPPDVESEEAWLTKVANNLVADFHRNAKRKPVIQARLGWSDDADDEERRYLRSIEQRQNAAFEEPGEQLFEEILVAVEDILRATKDPDGNQEIVRLIEEGYSYAEIGERGFPENRVRNALSRMRKKLAKLHPEWAAGRQLRGPRRGARRGGDEGTQNDDEAPDPPDTR